MQARPKQGFSLVEVTLAIGLIAVVLLTILGLIPVGTKSGRDAIDTTHVSMIMNDAEARIRASVTSSDFPSAGTPAVRQLLYFYDKDGVYYDTAGGYTGALYRVDATIGASWANALPNVDIHYLRPVTASVRWPVSSSNGAPLRNTTSSFSFYIRRP